MVSKSTSQTIKTSEYYTVDFKHSFSLYTVFITFEALLDTLEEICVTDGVADKEASATSGGLLSYFTKESFLFTAFTFKKIFAITDGMTKILQSPDFDLLSASEILQQKLDQFVTLRENFEKIVSTALGNHLI